MLFFSTYDQTWNMIKTAEPEEFIFILQVEGFILKLNKNI